MAPSSAAHFLTPAINLLHVLRVLADPPLKMGAKHGLYRFAPHGILLLNLDPAQLADVRSPQYTRPMLAHALPVQILPAPGVPLQILPGPGVGVPKPWGGPIIFKGGSGERERGGEGGGRRKIMDVASGKLEVSGNVQVERDEDGWSAWGSKAGTWSAWDSNDGHMEAAANPTQYLNNF